LKKFIFFLAWATITTGSALARTIVTDRPDFADATVTVPVGIIQVECGYAFSKVSSAEQHTFGQWLVKTGLSSRLELRLGIESYQKVSQPLNDISGFGDGSLGFKVRLHEGRGGTGPGSFNLTAIVFSSVPSGNREFRAAHLKPGVMFTSDLALSPAWTLAPFVQYVYTGDSSGQYSELSAGFSVVRALGERAAWFVEYFGIVAQKNYRQDTHSLGTGLTCLLADNVQIDLYGGAALNGIMPDYYLGAGLSFMVDVAK